jgi:hypothetical protein
MLSFETRIAVHLEHAELLLDVHGLLCGACLDLEHVEAHGLGQRAALANSDNISLLDGEGRGQVSRDVAMTFLVTLVLAHVVQVVTAHDNGALHLVGDHETLEDAAADRNVAGVRALLVYVSAINSGLRLLYMKGK